MSKRRDNMKPQNETVIILQSRSCNESYARTAVSGFFAQLDPTVEELCDIRTAVSEAVTNAIVHGYKDTVGCIRITARIWPGRKISVAVRDGGAGIPDIPKAMEPLFTTDPDGERSGLGFSVMQSFMDKVKVRSSPGKGTTVTMERHLKGKDDND